MVLLHHPKICPHLLFLLLCKWWQGSTTFLSIFCWPFCEVFSFSVMLGRIHMSPMGLIHKDVSAELEIGNLQYRQRFLEIISFQQSLITPLVLTLKIDPPTITPPMAPSVLSRGVNFRKNILNSRMASANMQAWNSIYLAMNFLDGALVAEQKRLLQAASDCNECGRISGFWSTGVCVSESVSAKILIVNGGCAKLETQALSRVD